MDSDAPEGTYHTTHDWERDGSLSSTIVEAIAVVRDAGPGDTDSLGTAVDIDALDRLTASLSRSPFRDRTGRVEFPFDGVWVEVTSGGEVTVRRRRAERTRGEVSTEEEFEVALARLVREAEANGVAVDGGWACRDESAYPDWGIEIYEVDWPR